MNDITLERFEKWAQRVREARSAWGDAEQEYHDRVSAANRRSKTIASNNNGGTISELMTTLDKRKLDESLFLEQLKSTATIVKATTDAYVSSIKTAHSSATAVTGAAATATSVLMIDQWRRIVRESKTEYREIDAQIQRRRKALQLKYRQLEQKRTAHQHFLRREKAKRRRLKQASRSSRVGFIHLRNVLFATFGVSEAQSIFSVALDIKRATMNVYGASIEALEKLVIERISRRDRDTLGIHQEEDRAENNNVNHDTDGNDGDNNNGNESGNDNGDLEENIVIEWNRKVEAAKVDFIYRWYLKHVGIL